MSDVLSNIIVASYHGGATIEELEEKHRRSYRTIRKILVNAGVTIRPQMRRKRCERAAGWDGSLFNKYQGVVLAQVRKSEAVED